MQKESFYNTKVALLLCKTNTFAKQKGYFVFTLLLNYLFLLIVKLILNGQFADRNLTIDGGIERNDRLRTRQTEGLQLVVDDVEQMMVVAGIYLYEHVETTCSVVTFYHFRNLLQFLNYVIKLSGILQVQTYVGARFISHLLRVDYELRTFQYSEISKLLNALVNSSATYIARTCHLQKRDAGISGNESEYFLVK